MICILQVEFKTNANGLLERLVGYDMVEWLVLETAIPSNETNRWAEFISIHTDGQTPEVISRLDAADGVSVIHHSLSRSSENVASVLLFVDEPERHILTTLVEENCVPFRIRAGTNGVRVGGTVSDWDVLKAVGTAVETEHQRFDLLSVEESQRLRRPFESGRLKQALRDELTAQQVLLLETAHEAGYFSVAKETTSADLAVQLEMSQSTFSEQMRNALEDLLTVLFVSSS